MMETLLPFAYGIGLALCTLGAAMCAVFPLMLDERPVRLVLAVILGVVLIIAGVALIQVRANAMTMLDLDRVFPTRTRCATSTPWPE